MKNWALLLGALVLVVGSVGLFLSGLGFGLYLVGIRPISIAQVLAGTTLEATAVAEGLALFVLLAYYKGTDQGFRVANQ